MKQQLSIFQKRFSSTSTSFLKELRQATGASLIDCKTALQESNNDLDKAKTWIFEKSKSVAAKISSRSAKNGLIGLGISDVAGALVELNCETDFVARNKDFQDLVKLQSNAVLQGKSLSSDEITKVAGKVRENIVIGKTLRLEVNGGVLGSYLHNQIGEGTGTAGGIVSIKTSQPSELESAKKIARALAVHIVGSKPIYISREQVPIEERKQEEEKILSESAEQLAGKSEKAKEGLLRGKLQKFYASRCLLDQSFILGEFEGTLVKDILGKNLKIESFIRLSLGGDYANCILK